MALSEEVVYFNHAGVAPIPLRSARLAGELAMRMAREGAMNYPELLGIAEQARRRGAAWLGVGVEEVGLVASTSEGLSMVALGMTWRPGDEVVTTDQEFPANAVIWLEVGRRFGVVVHRVPSAPDGRVVVAELLARVTSRTRVVAVSQVQFGTGAVVAVAELGRALAGGETLLVVDAIQGLGAIPLPIAGVDAVVADGHKWLLGVEGCALFYLSPRAMAVVEPRVVGWHSVVNAGEYDRLELGWRAGMRRFEAGSPNLLGAAVLGASLEWLGEFGMATIAARVRGLATGLVVGLRERGAVIHTPLDPSGCPEAGIVVFSHPGAASARLHRGLSQAGVVQAARGGGIRLSPHFYQDQGDLERFFARLDRVMAGK